MRLFISIVVPDQLREYCRTLQKKYPGLKNLDEFHLTLQFLGDHIHELFLPRLTEALGKIEFKPFEIQLGTPRKFPNEDRPNGVWIDCDGGEELKNLADRIRKAMTLIGFPHDLPFAAHITLGRYKVPPQLIDSRLSDVSIGPGRGNEKKGGDEKEGGNEKMGFTVDRFHLMQSHLGPEGASYKTLAVFQSL